MTNIALVAQRIEQPPVCKWQVAGSSPAERPITTPVLRGLGNE